MIGGGAFRGMTRGNDSLKDIVIQDGSSFAPRSGSLHRPFAGRAAHRGARQVVAYEFGLSSLDGDRARAHLIVAFTSADLVSVVAPAVPLIVIVVWKEVLVRQLNSIVNG